MKRAILILAWVVTVAASAQTNETWKTCRNPVRVFPGAANVDLTPLFQWWERQPQVLTNSVDGTNVSVAPDEERPLAAWSLISGTKAGTAGSSWVVEASIYTSPTEHTNARIMLKNPPTVEEELFYNLKTQLNYTDQQLAGAWRAYSADTNAEIQADTRVEMYRRSISKVAPTGVVEYSRISQRNHDAAVAATQQIDQLEAQRKQIDAQLKTIPSINGYYLINWFAVYIGHTKAGVPIYDMGLVSATPP
jgi:hypothetical protein